jgi:hypothetical protein
MAEQDTQLPQFGPDEIDPETGLPFGILAATEKIDVRFDTRMQRNFALGAKPLLLHYYQERVEKDDETLEPLTPQSFMQRYPQDYEAAKAWFARGVLKPDGWNSELEDFPPRISDEEYGQYIVSLASMRQLLINSENNRLAFEAVAMPDKLQYLLTESRREFFIQFMTNVFANLTHLINGFKEIATLKTPDVPETDEHIRRVQRKQQIHNGINFFLTPKITTDYGFSSLNEALTFFQYYQLYLELDKSEPYLEQVFANRPGSNSFSRELGTVPHRRNRRADYYQQQEEQKKKLGAARSAVFIFFYINHQYPSPTAEDSILEALVKGDSRRQILHRLGLKPDLPHVNIFEFREEFATMFPGVSRNLYNFNTPHTQI